MKIYEVKYYCLFQFFLQFSSTNNPLINHNHEQTQEAKLSYWHSKAQACEINKLIPTKCLYVLLHRQKVKGSRPHSGGQRVKAKKQPKLLLVPDKWESS